MTSTAHLFRFGIPINGIELRLKGFEVLPTAVMGMYATKKIADSLNLDDETDYMAEVMNGGFVGVIIPQLLHTVHAPLLFAFEAFATYWFLFEENIEHPNLPRERTKYFIENINYFLQSTSVHLKTGIKYFKENFINSADTKHEKIYGFNPGFKELYDEDKYKKFYDDPETKKWYEERGFKENYSYDEFVEIIAPPEVRYKGIKIISISKEAKYKTIIVGADDAAQANLNSIEEQSTPTATSSVTHQEVEVTGETNENTEL